MSKEFDRGTASTLRRDISIRAALEWAFGVEHADLDFDDLQAEGTRPGVSTIWVMIQRGQLGCQIDGGGRSRSASDAEVIANVVAALPDALGGARLAVDVVCHARAGAVPDWMPDCTPRCVPQGWRNTKHGVFAQTERLGTVKTTYRGRSTEHDVTWCPVTYTPSASQIGMARRRYLNWYGALLHLRHELSLPGVLDRLRLTPDMPVMVPWRGVVAAGEKAA